MAVAAILCFAAAPLDAALVGYWNFDGTVDDFSNNGHHGTRQPAANPPTFTAGHTGDTGDQALDYDGANHTVALGNPSGLQLQAMAVSFWMSARTKQDGIVSKGQSRSPYAERDWDVFGDGDELSFIISNGSSAIVDLRKPFPSLNNWHHVVASWDGTTDSGGARLYVDGTLLGSDTVSSTANSNTHDLYLGGLGDWTYNGRLDDVAIFDGPLNERRITDLSNGTITPLDLPGPASGRHQIAVDASNPVAYWRLDEQADWPTAYDSTENQFDGAVAGGTFQRPSVNALTGTAVQFDDSNPTEERIEIGNPAELQLNSMSIAFWMNAESNDEGIITKGRSRSSFDSRDWDVFGDGSNLCFAVGDGSNAIIDLREPFPSLDAWHHVVATWDGTTNPDGAKLYVDGALLGTDTASSTANSNVHDLFLGGSGSYRFGGLLDEVAIFDYALSATEVRGLYSAVVPEPGSLALLLMGVGALLLRRKRPRNVVSVIA
jgi:hypothetical protein